VEFFLERFSRNLGKEIRGVTPETTERLRSYHWPGNVRELENLVERAVVLATGPIVSIGEETALPAEGRARSEPAASPSRRWPSDGFQTLAETERRHIEASLTRSAGVIEGPNGAAKMLGLHPSTLRSRMKKLGITSPARRGS
jgi:formate hydrogenlyase transcriptional activator